MGKEKTMPEQKQEKAKGITWDLRGLYPSDEVSDLERDLERAQQQATGFQKRYHQKIADEACTVERLLEALQTYEAVIETLYRPYATANLLFAGDSRSDAYKATLARAQDVMTRVENLTLFFSLEIQQLPQEQIDALLADERLQPYRHYIESLRLFTPYMLDEREEQIINQKNLTGRTAFVNLFDEFTTTFEWQFELDGELRTLTASELRELVRHPDPEVRYRAKQAHDGRYGEHALIFTNILGSLIRDHAQEIDLRGYDSPIQPTHLRNKVPPDVVETMMRVTAENYSLVREYYQLKAKALGVPKLRGSDLYAPLSKSRRVVPFEEGQALVLDSFGEFSPDFREIVAQAFEKCWIDAEVRPGKRGGAFCYGITPSVHPYILMNYVDNLDSVYTMAHEFGHALHDVLSGRQNSILTYHPPLVLAETASVFAEMLLTRKLLASEDDPQVRKQILASKLEDFFSTISRQTMYTYFELDAHLAGAKRRLSAGELSSMWIKRRDELYGDVIEFLPEEQWFWAVIPHFIHTRFYCYAYTFGALLVFALFHRYEQEGEAFVPRYRALLAAGNSDWPEKLIAAQGMDFTRADFWQGGFEVIRSLLDEFADLVQ